MRRAAVRSIQSGRNSSASYRNSSKLAARTLASTSRFQPNGAALPLLQAPLAGVQLSELCIAVTNAGYDRCSALSFTTTYVSGIGALPCAMLDLDKMTSELRKVVAAVGNKPWNVNFFAHTMPAKPQPEREQAWRRALAPDYAEFGLDMAAIPSGPGRRPFTAAECAVVEQFRPPIVSFHFGLPAPDLVARVKRWGALVLSSATTVAEARWLAEHGADAIIAQGSEAGGHRGNFLGDYSRLGEQSGTFALLPQVVQMLRRDAATASIPVIAAGGIVDAATVKAAFDLGAAAVQVGTAFMLCPEATTSPVHRRAIQQAQQAQQAQRQGAQDVAAGNAAGGTDGVASHTELTNLFTGRPARGLVNRFMRDLGPMGSSELVPEFPLATNAVAPLRAAAEKQGSGAFSPLWAGQNLSGCRAVPAAEIVKALFPDR